MMKEDMKDDTDDFADDTSPTHRMIVTRCEWDSVIRIIVTSTSSGQ